MTEVLDLGFEMKTSVDGQGTEFKVRGSGLGGGAITGFTIFAIIFGLLAGVMNAGMSGTAGDFWTGAIVTFAIGVGMILVIGNIKSKSYSFKVTPKNIEFGGRDYAKADISEVFVRNAQGKSATQATIVGGTIVFGNGIAGAAAVGAVAVSNAVGQISGSAAALARESMDKRSNAVCIRHGRNVIPLAENLEADVAISLFNKVTEVI
jgi:hypothetical protein